jgi:hypothetical protein
MRGIAGERPGGGARDVAPSAARGARERDRRRQAVTGGVWADGVGVVPPERESPPGVDKAVEDLLVAAFVPERADEARQPDGMDGSPS